MLSQAEMALVEKMMDALQIGSSQHKVVKGDNNNINNSNNSKSRGGRRFPDKLITT
ncbi:unnamed protein product [Polarella glacialis]|uniref:Uncharacterized protein n=1 Tax=Polarella glacialis TaxID=89957 RepID=A0A813L0T7_POLGL|nr:unnamed protein product [Polarella glacialis]